MVASGSNGGRSRPGETAVSGTRERPPQTCEVCGARVHELRRGRCWGCYQRWVESRPVPLGAACAVCGERRRDHLKTVELLQAWVAMCHNCAARATSLTPMPQTLDDVRRALTRDRRRTERRRGRADTRVFKRERRGLERRSTGLANGDDLMLLGEDDIVILDDVPGEETRIKPAP